MRGVFSRTVIEKDGSETKRSLWTKQLTGYFIRINRCSIFFRSLSVLLDRGLSLYVSLPFSHNLIGNTETFIEFKVSNCPLILKSLKGDVASFADPH